MSIVQVILVCSSPKAKTLSKPEPVQTGIKVSPRHSSIDRFYCITDRSHDFLFVFYVELVMARESKSSVTIRRRRRRVLPDGDLPNALR